MSQRRRSEQSITNAKEHERKYDWLNVIGFYKEAIKGFLDEKEYLRRGEVWERISYCYYRAAYQCKTKAEFKILIEQASQAYENAANNFDKIDDVRIKARVLSNKAQAVYCQSLRVEEPFEKWDSLDLCIKLGREALKAWEEVENDFGYSKMCNEFLTYMYVRSELISDWKEEKKILDEVLEYSLKNVDRLIKIKDEYELTRAYYLISLHLLNKIRIFESIEKQNEVNQKCMDYALKSVKLSQKLNDDYLIGKSIGVYGLISFEIEGDIDAAQKLAHKQLELGIKTKDIFIQAQAKGLLAYYLDWLLASREEDPDRIKEIANNVIKYAEESLLLLNIAPHNAAETYYVLPAAYHYLARVETDFEKKLYFERKQVEVGREIYEQAKNNGLPFNVYYALSTLGAALPYLASLETNINEKRKLLEEALDKNEKQLELCKKLEPFQYWNCGIAYNTFAMTKKDLAKIESNNDKKQELLTSALINIKKSLEMQNKHYEAKKSTHYLLNMARGHLKYCKILIQLHSLSNDETYLKDAISSFNFIAKIYKQNEMHIRLAEIYWNIAICYDQLKKYFESSDEFNKASIEYKNAIDKNPILDVFYHDYVIYMKAWNRIEKAKQAHINFNYEKEKDYYSNAANLHKNTKRWNHLYTNYTALALLADAENCSRKERIEDAKNLFNETADLFTHAKKVLEDKIELIWENDEREMVERLIITSEIRRDYCIGRIYLEDAKLLDKQGRHTVSSNKYAIAAQTFEKIIDALKSEEERRELRQIFHLCKAWQKMTQAEAETSSELYMEASLLFEKAKEYCFNEKTRLLTLGHACFCRALGAGTRYILSKTEHLHQEIIRHLGSATNFYIKAGYEPALEYSKATQRLFDAYAYIEDANRETDPERKARYFLMAEKILKTSTESFLKANHPEKSEEARRFLVTIREERELARSLNQILHAPDISSSTTSFDVPISSNESAVGLVRFDYADVQVNIIGNLFDVKVGETIDLEINLYNAGKIPASLVKAENVIPTDFSLDKVSGFYKIDNGAINLKGKRLGSLSTENIVLTMKSLSKGEFTFQPRIIYLDESGVYNTSEPEPTLITVKEMGILGWLRGTRAPR